MNYDVIIVGAGFSGLACAKALVKEGLKVCILERKPNPGHNVHTTGILVKEALEELPHLQHLKKEISKVYLYAPNLKSFSLESDRYIFTATDTGALLDEYAQEVAKLGCEFRYSTAFKNAVEENSTIFVNDRSLNCRFLIGADGARSAVAKCFDLVQNKQFLLGAEIELEYSEKLNPDGFHCFLTQKWAKGYLGWIVPGKPYVQVGVASQHSHTPNLKSFLEHIAPVFDLRGVEVKARRGGLIPVGGLIGSFYKERVLLIGDSSGVVSPLTAGGIHPALRYGRISGELLASHLKNNGPHPSVTLKKLLPRFHFKHFLKNIFYSTPDPILNIMISNPIFKSVSERVFYDEKRLR